MTHPPPSLDGDFIGLVEFTPGFRPRPQISHVLLDFDGTLSLVRQGWPEIMSGMFDEILPHTHGESDAHRKHRIYDDILRLNGQQTIHQMIRIAKEIRQQGGEPRDPVWYKNEYMARLDRHAGTLANGLKSGSVKPDQVLLHGSRALLDLLTARGMALYLLSGSEESLVEAESAELGIAHYFGNRIHGSHEDSQETSKRSIIARILHESGITGDRMMAIGDGHVEIENIKAVGGFAVAVASDEAHNGSGRMDESKRAKLLSAGADVVIPDFRDAGPLLDRILGIADGGTS